MTGYRLGQFAVRAAEEAGALPKEARHERVRQTSVAAALPCTPELPRSPMTKSGNVAIVLWGSGTSAQKSGGNDLCHCIINVDGRLCVLAGAYHQRMIQFSSGGDRLGVRNAKLDCSVPLSRTRIAGTNIFRGFFCPLGLTRSEGASNSPVG